VVRGGGDKVRKKLVAAQIACMFVLVCALSTPLAVAKDNSSPRLTISFEADVVWADIPYWTGTVSGDISGSIVLMENPATFPGQTEHFDESWTITTNDGVVLKGYDLGVYNLNVFKFRANGEVTSASSSEWEFLVGYAMHFSGSTTPLVIGGYVHGTGTIALMPP
jgi:hypothetical protein